MRIGYYVHHHGAGHRARAEAISAKVGDHVTLLGTGVGNATNCVDLPDDRLDANFSGEDDAARPAWLHYAPLHHRGVQQRNARIANWIAKNSPKLFVVDVSVEIACLARLCGVPVVYVRLPGHRDDLPHIGAFSDAVAILAPFPKVLEPATTPRWITAKTFYTGYIACQTTYCPASKPQVIVIVGKGGVDFSTADIASAAAATPAWHWTVLGDIGPPPTDTPSNLCYAGWVFDPGRFLSHDTILVAGGGDGAVALAVAAGCSFICVPQTRPYFEQHVTGDALSRIRAAITCPRWPNSSEWPNLLEEAAASDSAPLAALHDPEAAERTGNFLLSMT